TMSPFSSANSLLVSVRLYRALLVAYPQTFRDHYESQMVQVFRDSFREAYQRHGMPGAIDLWLHTSADLVFTSLRERLLERSQLPKEDDMSKLWLIKTCGRAFILGSFAFVTLLTGSDPIAIPGSLISAVLLAAGMLGL